MKKKVLTSLILAAALVLAPLTQDLVMTATATGNNTVPPAPTTSGNNTAGGNTSGSTSGSTTEEVTTFSYDEPREVDWNGVNERINAAVQAGGGRNVDVVTGRYMSVSTSVLNNLAGKNVTLALHNGSGFAISLTGTDLRNVNSNFTVNMNTSRVVPEEAARQILANAIVSREFSMEEKTNYPFRVNVHMSLGAEHAGRLAVLYYYDEGTGTMRVAGSYRINATGHAMFGLSRGDEYIVVVGGNTANGNGYTVVQGDTLGAIASRNGVTINALLAANPQITDANRIYVGQTIIIP